MPVCEFLVAGSVLFHPWLCDKNTTKLSVFLPSPPVFSHRFIILDIDDYALKYMESNAAQYSPEALSSIQNHVRKREAPASELEKYVWLSRAHFDFGTYDIFGK